LNIVKKHTLYYPKISQILGFIVGILRRSLSK
jgi:hypothetical protein